MRDESGKSRKRSSPRRIERLQLAAGDRRFHEGRVQQAFGHDLALITGPAGDLEDAFIARDGSVLHDWPPAVCRARMTALRSRGTLNALPSSGLAPSIASSLAATKACSVGARPMSAASLPLSRQGRGATPPAASLASAMTPSSMRRAAATET